jgi:replicative DNA helicase
MEKKKFIKTTKTTDKTSDMLKVPPHFIDAERSILGGVMLDHEAWEKVSGRVVEEDFYRQEHRILFGILKELARRSQPFDVITVINALNSSGKLEEVGGESYLWEMVNDIRTVANIASYSDIVREKSVLRQLIGVSNEIADSAFNPQGRELKELLNAAEAKVFAIAEQTGSQGTMVMLKDILASAVDKIDHLHKSAGTITGMATGFTDLDEMTSGLQKSDLIIVAGRPSMGKTTLVMNLAEYAAVQHKKPVLVFSMEMPADALVMRMIASLGRVNLANIRAGKLDDSDFSRIMSVVNILSEAPLFIDDTPGLSPMEVRARARRLAREHGGLGLVVIDYLQLMRVPGFKVDNRTAEISEISRSLKELARELSVPVVALSQLNRSLEQRSDRRPMMSDLRESGAIEQDADLIVFIYRDEVYNPESMDKGVAEIIIAKHRNGPIGKIRLAFLAQHTRFENLAFSGPQGYE